MIQNIVQFLFFWQRFSSNHRRRHYIASDWPAALKLLQPELSKWHTSRLIYEEKKFKKIMEKTSENAKCVTPSRRPLKKLKDTSIFFSRNFVSSKVR